MADSVEELTLIEAELRGVEAKASRARDPIARARIAAELGGLKRRIDKFIRRPDVQLPEFCTEQLRNAAAEIDITVTLLVGSSHGGSA
jgi:hypothetical protein